MCDEETVNCVRLTESPVTPWSMLGLAGAGLESLGGRGGGLESLDGRSGGFELLDGRGGGPPPPDPRPLSRGDRNFGLLNTPLVLGGSSSGRGGGGGATAGSGGGELEYRKMLT